MSRSTCRCSWTSCSPFCGKPMMLEKCELIPCSRHSRTMSLYVSGRFWPLWAASRTWRLKDSTPDEHLKTAGFGQQFHQLLLPRDLRIALDEELQPELLVDHGRQQRLGLGILIEIIRGEHNRPHAGRLGSAQAGQGGRNALAANLPAGNLDDRTEVAKERAAAGRVQPQHREDIPAKVLAAGWDDDWCFDLLLPAFAHGRRPAAVHLRPRPAGSPARSVLPLPGRS
jgi:hypothetical protein